MVEELPEPLLFSCPFFLSTHHARVPTSMTSTLCQEERRPVWCWCKRGRDGGGAWLPPVHPSLRLLSPSPPPSSSCLLLTLSNPPHTPTGHHLHHHTYTTMQNEVGQNVDLYIPRKW